MPDHLPGDVVFLAHSMAQLLSEGLGRDCCHLVVGCQVVAGC